MSPSLMSMILRPTPVLVLVLLAAMLLAAPIRADEADDLFAVAAGHYARQRWKLAVEEFRGFLERHPNHRQANQGVFYLAEALLQSGQTNQAGLHFRQYLNREPGGRFAREALFRAGEAAYLVGKFDLAKTELKQFLSKYPDDKVNAYVLPYLGDIALGQGDVPAALRYFRSGLNRFPHGRLQDDCRFGLARALERQNQNEEAERLYLAVAGKTGNRLADDAQFHLGVLQYVTGKHAQAIETFAAFETRLAESPWKPNARLGHGWALLKLNRLDEAKSVLERITADQKVGVEARYWLGMIQRMEGDWASAAETLLAAAAAGPEHKLIPAIRFHAGDALLRAGDTAAASEQFGRVIASETAGNEWVDDAIHGKVQAALQTNDHQTLDREAAEFDKRFPRSPLKGDVHRMLARSLVRRKQHATAVKLLEPLVAVGISDKQGLEGRFLLALAYEGLERHEDALAVLLPVLGSAEGRLKSDAQLTQGSLLLAMQRYADAVEPLEAFLATNPTGDEEVKGRGELAICYARSDQLERAKKVYAELLEKHPQHKLILPTTEQLAEAAYDAGDTEWSTELFRWLLTDAVLEKWGSQEYELKGMAGLGWSQLRAGKLDEAAATFEKLLAKNPPAAMAAEAAMVRGRILEQLDQSDPALVMYDLVIDEHPKTAQHPKALLAAARLRDKLQQDQESAVLYERLVAEYPELTELDVVLYEWAWVLDDLGKPARSSELFERLRKQHPQSRYATDATYRLARRALAAKDYARAIELTSEVLAGKPGPRIREHALYLRGQIAVSEDDWDQVRESFAALAREFPESPRRPVAEYWIAETAYRGHDYEAAGKLFDRLAQQTQGRRETWLAMIPLRRAQVLAQLNKWNEAHVIVSKIELEYPNFGQQYEADYLIGRCLASRADFQGARDAYLKVIRSQAGAKTETAAMAQWMIGETFFHQKNYEAALREYLKVEILYAYPTWQAAALLQAGKCRDLLGESKEADKLYAQLMKVYPDTRLAEEASRRLLVPPSQRGAAAIREIDSLQTDLEHEENKEK